MGIDTVVKWEKFYQKEVSFRIGTLLGYIIFEVMLIFLIGILADIFKLDGLVGMMLINLVTIIVIFIYFFKNKIKIINKVNKTILFSGVLIGLLMISVPAIMVRIFPQMNFLNDEYLISFVSNSNIIVVFMVIGVLGPISEELFFRVILIDVFNKKWRFLGVIVSSVLFSLMHKHNSILSFVTYAIMGLILGIAYMKTDKFEIVALAHIINNSASLVCNFS